MGLVAPRVLGYLSDARVRSAKLQIDSLSAALDLFYLDAGPLPLAVRGPHRADQAPGERRQLERPLPEAVGAAAGSVGPSLPVSRARPELPPMPSFRLVRTAAKAGPTMPVTSSAGDRTSPGTRLRALRTHPRARHSWNGRVPSWCRAWRGRQARSRSGSPPIRSRRCSAPTATWRSASRHPVLSLVNVRDGVVSAGAGDGFVQIPRGIKIEFTQSSRSPRRATGGGIRVSPRRPILGRRADAEPRRFLLSRFGELADGRRARQPPRPTESRRMSKSCAAVSARRARGEASREAGFTLIEMLVAIAILAVLVGIVPRSFVFARSIIDHSRDWMDARLVAESVLNDDADERRCSLASAQGTLMDTAGARRSASARRSRRLGARQRGDAARRARRRSMFPPADAGDRDDARSVASNDAGDRQIRGGGLRAGRIDRRAGAERAGAPDAGDRDRSRQPQLHRGRAHAPMPSRRCRRGSRRCGAMSKARVTSEAARPMRIRSSSPAAHRR